MLIAVASIAFLYGKRQSHRRAATKNELELTERLLGDVQDENTRVTEENVLMEQLRVVLMCTLPPSLPALYWRAFTVWPSGMIPWVASDT
jgi:hypothetical protein